LEIASKIDTVVLDKTGTLTIGKPEVVEIVSVSGFSERDVLRYAAMAEKNSEHPLADAVLRKARADGLTIEDPLEFRALPGKGIEATANGKKILLGNSAFMEESGVLHHSLQQKADDLAGQGNTVLYLALDGVLAGLIACSDLLKPDAIAAIDGLHRMGIDTVMLTGDSPVVARAIAEQAGIKSIFAQVLPDGKAAVIKELQAQGKTVAMVGDGINDAPALAQAAVGIAIGSGTDVAIESADIVLSRDSLLDISSAISLSRKTMRIIKQNLFWAFCYNILGIPVAAGLLTLFGGPLVSPMIAAAAMSLSSVSVVSNALRLKRFKNSKERID
jgi:Cu+-exporting ATPase